MKLVKSLLLGSAAGLTVAGGAQAADLPVKKAVPIEYVRVCTAYGAGFFYIPGTDTCLRISGRARAEYGYNREASRNVANAGDLSQFRSLLRINLDARTQTDYGTLRAFVRLEAASRTGQNKMASGTQARIGNAFFGTGQDAVGRVQNYIVAEKAFIQFAGLTAGRASSFFDFYAHDFEIIGSSLGSDLPSTNLLAYTHKFAGGFSATLSMEDPNFRKNPIYANGVVAGAIVPTPIILGTDPVTGAATAVAFIDAVQRSRMPDFVGSLRYDAPWGSAQLSAAVKDVNTGGFINNSGLQGFPVAPLPNAAVNTLLAARGISAGAQTEYGWAVQGGVKFNLPFIAPGDGLYLQGAYGEGANNYTGITSYAGTYAQNSNIVGGNAFNQWLVDAIVNPLTGKLELSQSFTVVASYLHYWAPQWRSAFYGSYGEVSFSRGARQAVSQTTALLGANVNNSPPNYNVAATAAGYALSPALRDNNIIVAGASLIWSPVKDLDIGVEGQYIRLSQNSGRANNADRPQFPASNVDTFQARFRVQRDF